MNIIQQKKLELDEGEAWEYYSFLLKKQRDLTEKLINATEQRDRDLIKEIVEESKDISKKLDHVDEFLNQFD